MHPQYPFCVLAILLTFLYCTKASRGVRVGVLVLAVNVRCAISLHRKCAISEHVGPVGNLLEMTYRYRYRYRYRIICTVLTRGASVLGALSGNSFVRINTDFRPDSFDGGYGTGIARAVLVVSSQYAANNLLLVCICIR